LDDDDAAMLAGGASKLEPKRGVKDEPFAVLPENWQAVHLFAALGTQWRWHETQRIGLIYSELHALMQLYEVVDKKACFEGVQIMEMEVLDAQM